MSSWRVCSERVRRALAGGDPPTDFPVKPEEVWQAAAQMIPFFAKKDFWENYQMGEKNIDNSYYFTFTGVTVYRDSGKYPYVVMPAKPNFIYGRGRPQFYYVGDMSGGAGASIIFEYIEPGQYQIYRNSEFGKYSNGIVRVWIENIGDATSGKTTTKAFFETSMDDCVDKVKIRFIPVAEVHCINPDAQMPIAANMEELLVEKLYQWFSGEDKEVQDVNNDLINQNK